MLKQAARESLHECYGNFLLNAPVVNIAGFGEGATHKLSSAGILTVGELLANLDRVHYLLSRRQIVSALNYACVLQERGVAIEIPFHDE